LSDPEAGRPKFPAVFGAWAPFPAGVDGKNDPIAPTPEQCNQSENILNGSSGMAEHAQARRQEDLASRRRASPGSAGRVGGG